MEQQEQQRDSQLPNNEHKTIALQNTNLRTYLLIGGAALGLLLIVLLIIGFLAGKSLPGSPLYSFKTDFIENAGSSVALSNEAKAESQLSFLAKRLEETKTLSSGENISEDAIADIQEQVTLRSTTLFESLAADKENYTSQNALRILGNYVGIISALEEITESDTRFGELGSFMEEQRGIGTDAYQERVDRFVERATPEEIFTLIQAQLTQVTQELSTFTLRQDTIDDAESYLNRVTSSMTEGDYPRAINAIASAHRYIQVDMYGAYALSARFEPPKEENDPANETATSTEEVATTSATLPI